MSPLRTGLALATTVALFYSLCTLAWVHAPGPVLWLLNSLFHGLEFSSLLRPRPFDWFGFAAALALLSAWALLAGGFFAWLCARLSR